jgi:hypothetical protein
MFNFATVKIADITAHENNSHIAQQYQWSYDDALLLSLSNSYSTHTNLPQQAPIRGWVQFVRNKLIYVKDLFINLLKPSGKFTYHQV